MGIKIQNIGLMYLLLEILIITLGIIDFYLFQKENTFLFKNIGESSTILSCIGIFNGIVLLGLWMRNFIETKAFIRQIMLVLIGIILPFLVLFTIVSQLK